jgi:hypothetical protein
MSRKWLSRSHGRCNTTSTMAARGLGKPTQKGGKETFAGHVHQCSSGIECPIRESALMQTGSHDRVDRRLAAMADAADHEPLG